jgi:hypothetical protein
MVVDRSPPGGCSDGSEGKSTLLHFEDGLRFDSYPFADTSRTRKMRLNNFQRTICLTSFRQTSAKQLSADPYSSPQQRLKTLRPTFS